MQHVDANLLSAQNCGYRILDHFVLPPSAWWDHYYLPLEAKLAALKKKYAADCRALKVIDAEQREIELYRRHYDCYGYVFYVLQRY
jgi:hypothetical protein